MIKFHDGTHADLSGYTAGKPWNDPDLVGRRGGRMHIWNSNETVIRSLLSTSTRQLDGLMMSAIAGNDSEVLWVIKGLHQTANPDNALMQECHLTLGFRGTVYHVACWFTGTQMPAISSVTAGEKHTVDLDGFKTVGKKGK